MNGRCCGHSTSSRRRRTRAACSEPADRRRREALPDLAAVVVNIISYAERYDRSPNRVDRYEIPYRDRGRLRTDDVRPNRLRWIQGRALRLCGSCGLMRGTLGGSTASPFPPAADDPELFVGSRQSAAKTTAGCLTPMANRLRSRRTERYCTNCVRTGRSPSATCSCACSLPPVLGDPPWSIKPDILPGRGGCDLTGNFRSDQQNCPTRSRRRKSG